MKLEEIFSEDNILAYSKACLELAIRIPDTKTHKFDFDTLVIPSRGAVPFFLGMCYSLKALKPFGGDQEDFYDSLHVQRILASLLPEEIKLSQEICAPCGIKTIVVPFTADLNLEKYKPEENADEYVSKTRQYWAKVTASFFKEPPQRKKDPYFVSFVDFILRSLEKRDDVAAIYESFPKVNAFSMIDTVISGRASHDILNSFDSLSIQRGNPNLNPYAFLIVDENGEKLKKDFKNYLTMRELQGRLDTQEIPRIVSEDEGASLLGVASTVYPSVMKASKNLTLGNNGFFIGAGSWHPGYDISPTHRESFNSFMNLIYSGINHIFSREYSNTNGHQTYNKFLEARDIFLRHRDNNIKNFRLGNFDSGLNAFNLSGDYTPQGVYETKSHVVHIPFDEESTYRAVKNIGLLTGARPVESESS